MGMTRRSALVGLGTVAALTVFKGCGGGGGGGSYGGGGNGGGSNGGGGSIGGALAGSIWYEDNRKLIMVPGGGTGTPAAVSDIRGADGVVSSYYPRISRKSPRYLQFGLHGAGSGTGTKLWVYDHATHRPYGFVDMEGYTVTAAMSPSGRYIGMRRSPESVYATGSTTVAGLTIVDIADIDNVRSLRSEMPGGGDAVSGYAWLDDDRFIYIKENRTIFTGMAGTDSSTDKMTGQFDQQGISLGGFDVHPDGKTMLVTVGSSSDGSVDIYLYTVDGQPIGRMTNTGNANSPRWSPDGSFFMYRYGTGADGCAPIGQCIGCVVFHAPASARNLAYGDGQQFDGLKVLCTKENFWSSIT